MPIFFIILAISIFVGVTSSVKRREAMQKAEAAKQAAARRQQTQNGTEAAGQPPARSQRTPDSFGHDRSPSQTELKKKLREDAERHRLEREALSKTLPARPEKPVAEHSDEDCGGGSIHNGYHEGVTQFANNRPPAVAGRLGHRLADEDDALLRESIAAENAKRAMARIAKLPPLAQGMVYSEILGKPKSETA